MSLLERRSDCRLFRLCLFQNTFHDRNVPALSGMHKIQNNQKPLDMVTPDGAFSLSNLNRSIPEKV